MIRRAEKTDRDLLFTLFSEFYASEAVLHSVPENFHAAALDELFSARPMQHAFLLCDGVTPCGYALLAEKFSHEAGGRELWLEELYLRQEARGKGLGSAFFAYLKPWAAQAGFLRIRLEIAPENSRAAALYHRHGFKPLDYLQLSWTPEEV